MSASYNPALRAHVTRVGFDLSLGKTHIAALVWVDTMIQLSRSNGRTMWIDTRKITDVSAHRAFSNHATGCRGLIERGLLEHQYMGNGKPFHRHYKITRAGRIVINLLKESGIWADFLGLLPAHQPSSLVVAS